MFTGLLHDCVVDMSPPVSATALLGLLMFCGFLTLHTSMFQPVLPGIPKLRGYPIVGAIPIYFRDGMSLMLETLTKIGEDGISYARVGNKTLVSVHDPSMVKEVLNLPDGIASRLGDPRIFGWSPFWTLIRLISNNLFDYVGPDARSQRGIFIREFNSPRANATKFDEIVKVASQKVNAIAGDENTAEVHDMRHVADTYAAALWGECLYGRSNGQADEDVIRVADAILARAGGPWASMMYSFLLTFRLITPGAPTRSEARLRAEGEALIVNNIHCLETYERNNPDAPMKTMRKLSVASGGDKTGPLTKFAGQFARLNLFGGHHSVGSNILWALIQLQKYSEFLTTLLAEVDAVDKLDFNTVNSKMPYLDAVIMEINRLYPTVPATLRVIQEETVLTTFKKPVVLKPGMLVHCSFLHLHTSPKFWGPTAGKFDPLRFVGGYDRKQPFMAFGYGNRDCVGFRYAILAVKVYMITLLKTYHFTVRDHNCEPKLNTLLETTGPVSVEFRRRDAMVPDVSERARSDSDLFYTSLPSRRFGILTACEI